MGMSEQSAVITAVLEKKLYYFLFPLLPGGLLVLCVLVGKPELRGLAMTSDGLGYIFRISILLGTAWVVGGVIFLVSTILTGLVAATTQKRNVRPWTIGIWRRIVQNILGNSLVPEKGEKEEYEWNQIYLALEKTFPDDSQEELIMLGTLAVSCGLAFSLGTIWWQNARLAVLYVLAAIMVLLGLFLNAFTGLESSEDRAARQMGMLFRHKLEAEKSKDDHPQS